MAGSRSKRDYSVGEPEPIPGVRFVNCGDGVFALIDESDWDKIRPFTWSVNDRGIPFARYPAGDGSITSVQLKAAVLMERMGAGFCIAHLDGDALNCRRSNLQKMTVSELRALTRRLNETAGVTVVRAKRRALNVRLERPSVLRRRGQVDRSGAEKSVFADLGKKD